MDINKVNDAFNSGKKKCYLSPKIEVLINSLIAAEFNASQLYKSMAVWCEYTGFLDRLEVVGNDKKGQYFIDKEIGCLV